jgi:putative endonuclease
VTAGGSGQRAGGSGQWAEDRAAAQLERAGLVVVARNYRCRSGEIDLIAADGNALVFVEVRYRRRAGYGSAAESIDRRKQLRVVQSARHFLQSHPVYRQSACRFDVILLSGEEADPHTEWITDAFQA